jgi:hypothetical protein
MSEKYSLNDTIIDLGNLVFKDMDAKLSQKSLQFLNFSLEVIEHIENYVVPQYGDLPDEMIENFTIEDLQSQTKRYAGRVGKNSRGKIEDHRDCLKLAHYACFIKNKLKKIDGCDLLNKQEDEK